MVCNQIDRRNSFGLHVFHCDIKQLSRNSLTTVFLICIYRADIGRKVLSVMKIIFNHAKAPCNTSVI